MLENHCLIIKLQLSVFVGKMKLWRRRCRGQRL